MKIFDKTKIRYFIPGIFLLLFVLSLSYARIFDEFEHSTLDLRYKLRSHQNVSDKIIIIEIGDDSIEKIGKWPFPRNYHALLINALRMSGVRTIVFDVFFSEKKEGDESFAEAVKEAGNVYMPYVFELDRHEDDNTKMYASEYAADLIKPLKDATYKTGFINVVPDNDGKVRWIPAFVEYQDKLYTHLTLTAAFNDLGYNTEELEIIPGKEIRAGEDLTIPLGEESAILVNYPDVWGKAFRHYSYIDVIQSFLADVTGQKPTVDLNEFKDSICFIGFTATASPDAHPSPMEPLYPGIGVHASVYNSVINDNFMFRLNRWWNMLGLLIICALTAFITIRSPKKYAFISLFCFILLYFVAALALFWIFGIWIDVFYPVMAILAVYIIFTFRKYVIEMQKRELMEKELDIARGIQRSFLPAVMPDTEGIKISVNMLTAKQVGGDLYDVIQLDDNKVGVMLGDVSGKGVPAALYMAKVVSVFKTFVKDGSADEVVKKINEKLISEGNTSLFVTLTYLIIDPSSRRVTYSIGGHLPTVLIEPDGNVELLDLKEGMPLGMMESNFELGEKEYKPGSIFLLYSDGVTEAMDTAGEMFEEERLVKLAKGLKGCTPEEAVEAVYKALVEFVGKAPQHDDITVMAIKV